MSTGALYQPEQAPERIAVFRALQLGDLLVAVPALRALRQLFPQAEITLIGLPWASAFFQRYSCYIDRFVTFAGYPGIREIEGDSVSRTTFLAEQRAYGYDLVIQMHGSGKSSNPFVLELQGRTTLGYYEQQPPAGLTIAAPYPAHKHEILRNLELIQLLGGTSFACDLEFPLTAEDDAEATELLPQEEQPFIMLHPGSRPPARRWPTEYFAQVGDYLAQRTGARILLTGAASEEATTQAVVEQMQEPALNLAGQTSLGALGALIRRSTLFISNDTGPAHIACAVDTPSITIFGPADYARWAPLEQSRHIALRRPVACSPCGYWQCPIDHRCLRWLPPTMVLEAAERLLSTCARPTALLLD